MVTEEDARKYIGKLKGYIKDPLCKEQVKFALSQFVHRVEISNEEVKATFIVAFAFFNASGEEYKYPYEFQCNIKRKELLQTYGEEIPFQRSALDRLLDYFFSKSCA